MSEIIGGLLLYRKKPDLQLLLAHPGGPQLPDDEEDYWNIPQNYVDESDQPLETLKHKFEESFGFIPKGKYIDLGIQNLRNKERIRVWAVSHDIPDSFVFEPFWFEMEWPPDSGEMITFPEMDRIEYFDPFEARNKLYPGQAPFLSKLITKL